MKQKSEKCRKSFLLFSYKDNHEEFKDGKMN